MIFRVFHCWRCGRDDLPEDFDGGVCAQCGEDIDRQVYAESKRRQESAREPRGCVPVLGWVAVAIVLLILAAQCEGARSADRPATDTPPPSHIQTSIHLTRLGPRER